MPKFRTVPLNDRGQITLFHTIIVGLSLLLTFAAWQVSKHQVETRIGLRFEASRDRAIGLIADRMQKYEDALWSGVATIRSHGGNISHSKWHQFTKTLRITERYPGINGIGVIHFHTKDTIGPFLEQQIAERPEFRIYPDHNLPNFMPITFIEPEVNNSAAIGLDVAHERHRRVAALKSRDTGTAQITGPITLVQNTENTAGFLFYTPLYYGEPPTNVIERRQRILGAVYAPFIVNKLMEGLLDQSLRDIRFSITDEDEIIYNEHVRDDSTLDPEPIFSEKVSIELYGRTWTLDMRSNLTFRQENTFAQPTIILISGLIIDTLIIALLYQMSQANKRTVIYANHVTTALRKQSRVLEETNANLSNKNVELEQIAYVTSHDLKTPIRGIRGLTEMIQEDLEEYFSSASAPPEIGTNLNLITDRVNRMDQLINGILEFSQAGIQISRNDPIELPDVIESLILDFGLTAKQLIFLGDIKTIHCDTFNLRCVLENLVGNAIKYHGGKNSLEITISAFSAGDRCHFSVTDNGVGIDPKFHERIFDIFQTLRTGNAPESTGIGLAIVKKAVERHDGKLTLVSSLGNGASFSFDWPIHESSTLQSNVNHAA